MNFYVLSLIRHPFYYNQAMIIRGVKMDVYIEITYLINLIVLMIVFEMMIMLLNLNWSFRKICGYSFICNLSLMMIYIDLYKIVPLIIWLIIFAFLFKKQLFLYYPTFLTLYFSVLYFIKELVEEGFIYHGILIIPTTYYAMSLFVVGLFFSMIQGIYCFYLKKKITNQHFCYQMKMEYLHHQYQITGFLDTGNETYYHGFPLIIIKKEILKEYQVIDHLLITSPTHLEIEIIMIDTLTINHQRLNHIYAGIISQIQYDCLLNKQLMGGIL